MTTGQAVATGQSTGLRRELGLVASVGMGLGSILGTGVFVSIGIAAGVGGPSLVLAIFLAGLVAACNALNSAQLAAALPTSGGTYAYGYKYLHPSLGFTAGWMFLWAKSASAATAALGFSGYLLYMFGVDGQTVRVIVALVGVVLLSGLVLFGLRRSNRINLIIVGVTITALLAFVFSGAPILFAVGAEHFTPFFPVEQEGLGKLSALFHATALMFVAYTGYGRIATLGEEVKDPRTTIPKAIFVTVGISMVVYLAVGAVGVGAVGADYFAAATNEIAAPLEVLARRFGVPGIPFILAIGAIAAMLGVLLNLILGLSRVLFAMGRQGDMPGLFGKVSKDNQVPTSTIIAVSVVILGLVLLGDVKTTWSFSAFTVLIYYSITNLAALVLPTHERLYPKAIAWAGLLSCLFLAFYVEPVVWGAGLALIATGIAWHYMAVRRRSV